MKQIGTKQFNSNDVLSLHRNMTAVKALNETLGLSCPSRHADSLSTDVMHIYANMKAHVWNFIS